MAGPGAVEAKIPVACEAVVQAQLGAVVPGFCAADVVAVGILEYHIVLVHEIHRQVVFQLFPPDATQPQLDIAELLRVQVGHLLVGLQPVEFGGLGRPEAICQAQVDDGVGCHAVAGAPVGAPVGEVVVAVGGAIEATGAGFGPAGRAVAGLVVIVVIGVLESQARAQLPVASQRGAPLAESRGHGCVHLVVVVHSRGLVGAEVILLVFPQAALRILHFQTIDPAAGFQVRIQRGAQPQAVVVVFFHRLPGHEVLQEFHLVVAQVGGDGQGVGRVEGAADGAVETQGAGIAVGFRVGVFAPQPRVLVHLVALDIACGFLVQVGVVEHTADPPYRVLVVVAQRGLLLVIACIIEIAAVGGSVDAHAQSMGTPGIAVAVLGPVVVVGAGLDGDVLVQLLAGCGADHVDQAMHRVGAIHCGGRALDDLDPPGLLGVGVEQLVDVAETGSPQADAVAGDQEGAATAGPCEHRRAQ